MKRIKILVKGMLVVIIGILGVYYLVNNTYSSDLNEKEDINTILSQLNDPDWKVNDSALSKLLVPRGVVKGQYVTEEEYKGCDDVVEKEYRYNERIRTALINLLAKAEQEKVPGEWYGEYVCCLRRAVASLNDPRALPYFLSEESVPGCFEEQRYIINIANENIVKTLLKKLSKEHHPFTIGDAIEILGEIVKFKEKGYVPPENIKEEIKQSIITTLKHYNHPMNKNDINRDIKTKYYPIEYYPRDEDLLDDIIGDYRYVRERAIRALGNFEDPELIPVIKPYLDDPYSEEREKTELRQEGKKVKIVTLGKITIYPVREEAERVIKLLEEKKKEEEKIKSDEKGSKK